MGLFGDLFKPRESASSRREWLDSQMRAAASLAQAKMLHEARRSFETAETPAYAESWSTSSTHINDDLERQLPTLWSRAVGLARNNEWAKRYLIELKNNVLGPNGIQLQMRLTHMVNGELVPDLAENQRAEDTWAKWGEDADESGLTLAEAEELSLEMLARKGEILIRLRPGSGQMGFQIQMLDPMLLDVTLNKTWNGNRVRMGKEVNAAGRPVAYWLQMSKTGELPSAYASVGRHVRIPAAEIIHQYEVEEVGQLRGVPWLTVGARRLWLTHDFEESAAVASSNAAKRQGFFYSPTGEAPPGFADTIVSSVLDAAKAAGKVLTPDEIQAITAAAEKYSTTVPGQFDTLPMGYQFQAFESAWPNINADTYVKQQIRGWAGARGMSYVTLGNDLEAVNYSSAQVGIIAEREHFKRTQTRLRDWLHRRIFAAALPYLAAAGGLALSRVKNGEYLDAATWQPRRWVPIDPLKAANANETNLRLGLTSRRRLIMERGEDPDEIAAEIAAETAIYGALDSSPAQPAAPAEDIEDANARAAIRHLKLAASRGYPDGA